MTYPRRATLCMNLVYCRKSRRFAEETEQQSEAEATCNKRLRSMCCIVEANYWQARSIARPVCGPSAIAELFALRALSGAYQLCILSQMRFLRLGWRPGWTFAQSTWVALFPVVSLFPVRRRTWRMTWLYAAGDLSVCGRQAGRAGRLEYSKISILFVSVESI